ncbi:DUF899 domain-containing protein [Pseudonocardia sp. WMMC193]|uniref:DUF899 domain-containing protein n=1 Tax=Pseudonocardia sp. WMMC193 TaxID=2911965 RepID=UPI001F2DB855|nr:DUF899 domain-containing protein [Pseudonocardia sp. WMMC193]MCF7547735.1 DUF899 domain-containing protein [Pseudonocardia sp. WMMC193]
MIVSTREWETARQELLVREKEVMRAHDALAAARRRMPWHAVGDYTFDGPEGRVSLADLFAGRSQLVLYRAFYEEGVFGWPERPCRGCSMIADHIGHLAHVHARDTTVVFASRAPQADIAAMKARMGWTVPWYTITDSFDRDHGVDEWHGTNVFVRGPEGVFRSYFVQNRGDESLGTTWSILDLTPTGRREEWEDSPAGTPQGKPYEWWDWHDGYVDAAPPPEWLEKVEGGIAAFRGCSCGRPGGSGTG